MWVVVFFVIVIVGWDGVEMVDGRWSMVRPMDGWMVISYGWNRDRV